jgi:hypothetical protein
MSAINEPLLISFESRTLAIRSLPDELYDCELRRNLTQDMGRGRAAKFVDE